MEEKQTKLQPLCPAAFLRLTILTAPVICAPVIRHFLSLRS